MAEEKKSAPKQSKKPAAPKKEAPKPAAAKPAPKAEPKKSNSSSVIEVGSQVITPSGKLCKVLSIDEDLCYLERLDNKKNVYLSKNRLKIKQ